MGDVTALVDTQGNVVVKYAYDAWGKVLSVTDGSGNAITDEYHVGNQNPFRYRGYYYDTETGFYYLQSRYYDPETGRFLNADGVLGANGDLTSYNMFAYCSNMPTVAVDYSGYGLFFDHDGKIVYGDGTTGNYGYYLDGSGRSFYKNESSAKDLVAEASTAVGILEETSNILGNQTKSSLAKEICKSTADRLGAAGIAVDGALLTWDLCETWSSESYNTSQKIANSAISVGTTIAGVGVGALAVAAANCWNPVGWGSAILAGASFLAVVFMGNDLIDKAETSLRAEVERW